MKVVVTGGAGFIGSHLVDALVDRGFETHVVDDLSAGKRERLNPSATLHVADVVDGAAMAAIFDGARCVFHMAALPQVQFSIERPEAAHRANVDGTLSVLEAARKAGVGRVVFSSSSAVYGDQDIMPLREDMPTAPKSPYALHKDIGERYCRTWHAVYGLGTVSLRYFNVYGPRMDANGAYALVMANFLKLRAQGMPLTITGDGTQTRDFVHVRDVVRANILAMESVDVGAGEAINIGSGRGVSVNDVAKAIGGPVVHVPARFEPHDTLADNSLAKRLLGWVPQVPFDEGVNELL